MAFNPRSDVILEVLNAADPARASLAAERLGALAGSAPSADFAADLEKAASSAPQAGLAAEGLADARSRLAAMADGPDKASRAKVEFEATLINSFIGELLPKDAGSVFGEGSAGDMWRSMLSEQISEQIAKSGALGLEPPPLRDPRPRALAPRRGEDGRGRRRPDEREHPLGAERRHVR